MAITIVDYPSNSYLPAYNDIVYVVSSNNTSQTNFKFVCDIYIDGATSYSFRLKQLPRPDGYAVFNIKNIINNYVESDIEIVGTNNEGFIENDNSWSKYLIKFGEEYGNTPVVYPNLTITGTNFVWNSVYDYLEFPSYSQNDTIIGLGNNFLSNYPDLNSSGSVSIRRDKNAWLYFIRSIELSYMKVITTNTAGSTSEVRISNLVAGSSYDEAYLRIPTGTNNLNQVPNSSFALGAQPIITSSIESYTVQLFDNGGAAASTKVFYSIDDTCTKNEVFTFQFLNKKGGFDFFDFIRGSQELVEFTKSNFKKVLGSVTAGQYGYNIKDRQIVQYTTTLKDKFTVQTDWLDETTMDWLEELIGSPEVYLDTATELIPVIITSTNIDKKRNAQTKIFNLTMTFEYAFNRYRQRF